MRLGWEDLGTARAEAADAAEVTISGFIATGRQLSRTGHFMLVAEPPCCAGCLPRDGVGVVEVLAAAPIPLTGRLMRLRGTWCVRREGSAG